FGADEVDDGPLTAEVAEVGKVAEQLNECFTALDARDRHDQLAVRVADLGVFEDDGGEPTQRHLADRDLSVKPVEEPAGKEVAQGSVGDQRGGKSKGEQQEEEKARQVTGSFAEQRGPGLGHVRFLLLNSIDAVSCEWVRAPGVTSADSSGAV